MGLSEFLKKAIVTKAKRDEFLLSLVVVEPRLVRFDFFILALTKMAL